MFLKKKAIYYHKIMERYKMKLDEANTPYEIDKRYDKVRRKECKLIASGGKYCFYLFDTYDDGSGGYILRQERDNPKNIVYFGHNEIKTYLFRDYLFTIGSGFCNRKPITVRNANTGVEVCCDWLSKKTIKMVTSHGNGHIYSQDGVKEVFIDKERLIFKISRTESDEAKHHKNTDKYDSNMEYDIVVDYIDDEIKVTAIYPDRKVSLRFDEKY